MSSEARPEVYALAAQTAVLVATISTARARLSNVTILIEIVLEREIAWLALAKGYAPEIPLLLSTVKRRDSMSLQTPTWPRSKAMTQPVAQKQVDRAGQPRRDANGKQIYSRIVEINNKATADRFHELILDLIHQRYPGVLEGDAS
jgi:hypothetical protein